MICCRFLAPSLSVGTLSFSTVTTWLWTLVDVAILQVDEWASFSAPPHVSVLIKELRQELDSVLHRKIQEPSFEMSTNAAVGVIMRLLCGDGF